MGNTAHLLNKAAGIEMIASQDHPLVLSSGIHHGTTAQWAAHVGGVHLTAHSAYSSNSLSQVKMCRRLAVLSDHHSCHILIKTSATLQLELHWHSIFSPSILILKYKVMQSTNLIIIDILSKLSASLWGRHHCTIHRFVPEWNISTTVTFLQTFTDINGPQNDEAHWFQPLLHSPFRAGILHRQFVWKVQKHNGEALLFCLLAGSGDSNSVKRMSRWVGRTGQGCKVS